MKLVISSWQAHNGNVGEIIEKALEDGHIDKGDTVWYGADGSYIVDVWIDSEETGDCEYTDAGTVDEFLSE